MTTCVNDPAFRKQNYVKIAAPPPTNGSFLTVQSAANEEAGKIWTKTFELEPENSLIDTCHIQIDGYSSMTFQLKTTIELTGETCSVSLELTKVDAFHCPSARIATKLVDILDHEMVQSIPICGKVGAVEQSFAQERLWFLDQLHPGSTQYVMPFAWRLRGPLQLDALHAAVLAVERRHAALRTTFKSHDGKNVQIVHSFRGEELRVVDMASSNDVDLIGALRKEQTTPFSLENEPARRICVYFCGKENHVLSIVLHHIISDGWSIDIFFRELSDYYSAALSGQDLRIKAKPLGTQYSDYSVWQRQNHQAVKYAHQLDYWIKTLQLSRPAEFVCDKPRPAILSGQADITHLRIEGKLYDDLHIFCRVRGLTPFMVLLAAFRAAHYRLTGATDATIGVPNANRDRSEVKDMIGFFVNMQCIRLHVEEESFGELIDQVKKMMIASFANQDVPFEKVVAKLHKDKDLSRHPLVQVVFALHSQMDLGKLTLEGVQAESLNGPINSRFDIEFHFHQEGRALQGQVIFSTDLYKSETISAMVSVFLKVLKQGLLKPEAAIHSLPLMTSTDYSVLNNMGLIQIKKTEYPRELSVIDVFRQQVIINPDRLAIKDSSAQLTYLQLDQQSDRLAQWLSQWLLPAESLVGVFASRSCLTVVAFLGILKANLAYLPMDVDTPTGRLDIVLSALQDSGLVLLETGMQKPATRLKDIIFVGIGSIVEDAGSDNQSQAKTSGARPLASSLAYVMFTSGSTGQPKGVMVEHRGILRLVRGGTKALRLVNLPTTAHVANIGFDASTWEIYSTLLNGGTLVCISSMDRLDYPRFTEIIFRDEIQELLLTPALLKVYLSQSPSTLTLLQTLYVGGDRVDIKDFVEAQRLVKGTVINAYGPTENSVVSTVFSSGQEYHGASIPIGRTINNSGAYVMDPQQQIVPLGVVGELVVTGDGLARGYLNPQQNTNHFISVAIGEECIKAYRTGDYVRQRPTDGLLEFIRRIDGQVKIRGHRVEPGEIEHIMRKNDYVDDAIVAAKQLGDQETVLLGFVTLRTNDTTIGNVRTRDGESDHVQHWGERFDSETYNSFDGMDPDILGRDFIGWTSMLNGDAINKEEMNEWLDDTIRTILNGNPPNHILEIGSGSGMILFNLPPELKSYTGIDPSERAVEFTTRHVSSIPALKDKVKLHRATAMDIHQLEIPVCPDTVILNSVVQYFPSQDYLFSVVERLLRLGSVKTVFFGDVRSYSLHRQFLVTRALHIAGDQGQTKEIRQLITDLEQAEVELLVDPGFFTVLPNRFPGLIQHVEILPKKMHATNELSCYRYAAVLHIKTQEAEELKLHEADWIDFVEQKLDRQSVLQLLREGSLVSVGIGNIPNPKTMPGREILDFLDNSKEISNKRLVSVQHESQECQCLSPLELMEIGKTSGYRVEISWARQFSQRGSFDAVFHRYHQNDDQTRVLFRFPTDHQDRPYNSLTNQPSQQPLRQRAQEQLRESLRAQLPSYMVPELITVLDKVPVNIHGKVDYQALINAADSWKGTERAITRQPTSEAESQIRRIWADVLGLEANTIGLDDNFFNLGGSSISAMKVVAEALNTGFQLKVADIFRHPVLCELSKESIRTPRTATDAIAPFSLLGDGLDLDSLLRSVCESCQLDDAMVLDAYPCTPLQEGLMSLTSKRPGDYIMQAVFEIPSRISIQAYCKAWEDVFRAFPILRTRIVHHDDLGLLQVVLDENIHWINAVNLEQFLHSNSQNAMTLGSPLVRYAFVKDGGIPKWFVWTIHHAVYDGWSMGLIIDAVHRAFKGEQIGRVTPFQPFIKYMMDQDPDKFRSYWKAQLADYESVPFPTTPLSLPKHQALADTEAEYHFPNLKQYSKQVTTPNLIRATWALIARLMGASDDVVFGAIVSGRITSIADVDRLAAPTFAAVPIRIKVNNDMRVLDYLNVIQHQALEMIPYEQAGLQRIAKMSSSSQRACMFQTLLIIQPHETNKNYEEILGRWQENTRLRQFNSYAMMLEVQTGSDNLSVKASFDSVVIKTWIVHKLLRQLEFVMQQLSSAGPEAKLQDIHMVPPQDLEHLWEQNTPLPIPVERCIHELVEEETAQHPNALAIDAWDGRLTYDELNQISAQIVNRLVSLGVGPNKLVPLCFEKSMWTSIAILGVLKAGGGFVLLDSSLPEQRLRGIVRQLNASFILSSPSNMDLCLRLSENVIELGVDSIELFRSCKINTLQHKPSSTTAMFAVFTSGSTGIPKGVVLEHRNICTALKYQAQPLGFSNNSRVFDFASYAFDVAVFNLFATLTSGGCLCIPSENDRRKDIGQVMAEMRVTIINLTPTVARLVNPATVPQLQTVILSGEPVTITDVSQWWGKCHIINAYGPAECGISTINWIYSTREDATHIGKGLGMATWVVDPNNHNTLLPPGCIGELLLEGPLIGRGYLNSTEETTLAFIRDPAWLLKGSSRQRGRKSRLYKTGDLVQYNEDGTLIYIGRNDTQVKIHGRRVELIEIERAVHDRIPGARQVAVEYVALAETTLPILMAFTLTDSAAQTSKVGPISLSPSTTAVLKRQLADFLPDFMIPTIFFSMLQFPMTVTGKLDRRRLRDIGSSIPIARVQQQLDTSDFRIVTGSKPIFETEQPAFILAHKVFSMLPTWSQRDTELWKSNETSNNRVYHDVLLLYSGLDSVNIMTLIYFVSQHFNVKLDMQLFMDPEASIRTVARVISGEGIGQFRKSDDRLYALSSTAKKILARIDYHDSGIVSVQRNIRTSSQTSFSLPDFEPTTQSRKSLTVLLTGATGFIGTEILRQLLEHRQVGSVIAITRGKPSNSAKARTIKSAKRALWWTDFHAEKLQVWQGDLSSQNLGLDSLHWNLLNESKTIDVIIHNGAVVHWGKSYAALEAANVASTAELLGLAVAAPKKSFLYVTGGQMNRPRTSKIEEEVIEEIIANEARYATGYSQTKFVSEALVRRAALRSMPEHSHISIVSPGLVVGTPTEGIPNADDFIWRLVAACLRVGSYNVDNEHEWVPISDVAATAAIIVNTALRPAVASGTVKQIEDGITWGEFWAIIQGLGYGLQARCATQWLAEVRRDIEQSRQAHPLWPVSLIFDMENQDAKEELKSNTEPKQTPVTLKVALKKSVELLAKIGFLPQPSGKYQKENEDSVVEAFTRSQD